MKLPEEAKKIGNFFEISNMDEEDEHSPSEFYYPEDLECHIINNLLTELARAVLGNIGPRSWHLGPIGSFSNDDGNGNENVMLKHKFTLLPSLRDYSKPFNMTKVFQSLRNETVTSGA